MSTKSFALALLGVFLGSALWPGVVTAARTVSSSIADTNGTGEICFVVDPSTDPDQLASAIAKDLELQHGPGVEGGLAAPEIDSVTVENGEAIVTYENAQPSAQVIGIIPDDDSATAAALLFDGAGCGIGAAPYAAGGLLGVVGGVLGGLAAAGEFDGDDGGDSPTPTMVPQPTPTPREPVSPSR